MQVDQTLTDVMVEYTATTAKVEVTAEIDDCLKVRNTATTVNFADSVEVEDTVNVG